jgi:hypothetical protein
MRAGNAELVQIIQCSFFDNRQFLKHLKDSTIHEPIKLLNQRYEAWFFYASDSKQQQEVQRWLMEKRITANDKCLLKRYNHEKVRK